MSALDIGTQKQLFIDGRFIESSDGVELTMNPPVHHPEPVLVSDRPWEELGIGAYNTVWREPDGAFRMWYDAWMKAGLPAEGARRLAYAESDDGIHWRKPELGLISFRGSTQNNIVAPHVERQSMQGATVFRDDRAPAGERYKLWTKFRPTDEEVEAGALQGLWAMHSPDGIHWETYPDQPNPRDAMCDVQNMLFWDDRLQLYVGYIRVRHTQMDDEAAEAAGRGSYRCVGRITSPDFASGRRWRSSSRRTRRTWHPRAVAARRSAPEHRLLHQLRDEVPVGRGRLPDAAVGVLPLGRERLSGDHGRAAPDQPGRRALEPRGRPQAVPAPRAGRHQHQRDAVPRTRGWSRPGTSCGCTTPA